MGLLDDVGGLATSVIDRGSSLASDVAKRAQSPIGAAAGTLLDTASAVATGPVGGITRVLGAMSGAPAFIIADPTVRGMIGGALGAAGSTAGDLADDIRNRAQRILGSAAGILGDFMTDPVGAIDRVIDEARGRISGAYDEAMSLVGGAEEQLRSLVEAGIDSSVGLATSVIRGTGEFIARQTEHIGGEILNAIEIVNNYARRAKNFIVHSRRYTLIHAMSAIDAITRRARTFVAARIHHIVHRMEGMVHRTVGRAISTMVKVGFGIQRIVDNVTGGIVRRIHNVERNLRAAIQAGHNLISGAIDALAAILPAGLINRARGALAYAELQVATVSNFAALIGATAEAYRGRANAFMGMATGLAIATLSQELFSLDQEITSLIEGTADWVLGTADAAILFVAMRIQQRVNNVINNITNRLTGFIATLTAGLTYVRSPIQSVIAQVGAIARGVSGSIADTVGSVISQEVDLAGRVAHEVAQGDIFSLPGTIARGISEGVQIAAEGGRTGVQRAHQAAGSPIDRVVEFARNVTRGVARTVSRIVDIGSQAVVGLGGMIVRGAQAGMAATKRVVSIVEAVAKRGIDTTVRAVGGAARRIGRALEPVTGPIAHMVEALGRGVSTLVGAGLSMIGNAANSALSFATGMRDRATNWMIGAMPHDGDLTGVFVPRAADDPDHARPGVVEGSSKGHAAGSLRSREAAIASGEAQIFVNGINTSLDEHYSAAQRLADTTNRAVVGVYNASGGMVSDVVECVINKVSGTGLVSPTASPAVRTMTRLIRSYGDARRPNGGLTIFAHSQGSLIVSEALRQAQESGTDLSHNDVTTFGNAAFTFPAGPSYHHYVHDDDVVPGFTGASGRISAMLNWLPGPLRRMLGMGETTNPRSRTVSLHHGGSMIDPHAINAADGHDYLGDLGRFRAAERAGRTGIDPGRAEGSSSWAIARGPGTMGADAISSGYDSVSKGLGGVPGFGMFMSMADPFLRMAGRNVRSSAEAYSAYRDREEAAGRTPRGPFEQNMFGETMLQAFGPAGFLNQARAAEAPVSVARGVGTGIAGGIQGLYRGLGAMIPGLGRSSLWQGIGQAGANVRDSVTGYMRYRDQMMEQGQEALGPFQRNFFGEMMLTAMGPLGMMQNLGRGIGGSVPSFPTGGPLGGMIQQALGGMPTGMGGMFGGMGGLGGLFGSSTAPSQRTASFPASWSESEWSRRMGGNPMAVMREGDGAAPDIDASWLRDRLLALGGPGSQLPSDLGRSLGGYAGGDISGARIHTGPAAQTASRELSARAFTIGPDIFFAQGEYEPGTTQGQALLGHELTHVVQQSSGNAARFFSQHGGDEMEREAQRTAERILQGLGSPDGLIVEACFCSFEGDGIPESDVARIERLAPSAVRAAELFLAARGIRDVTIDDLDISVGIDIHEANDTEIIDLWARQIADAVAASPRSRAGERAGRTVQRWPDGLTWSRVSGGESDRLGVSGQAQLPGQDPRQNFLNSLGAVKGALLEVTSMADSLLWLDYITAHRSEMMSRWGGRIVRFFGGDEGTEATLRRWHVIESLDDARRVDSMMAMASQGTWQSPHQYMMRIPTMVELMRPYGLIQEGSDPPMLQISRSFSQHYDQFAEWTAQQIGADLHREDYLFLSPYEVGEIEGALAVTIGLAFVGASEAQWAVNLTRAVGALGAVGGARGLLDAIDNVYRTNPNPSARDFVTREIVFAFLNFFASVIGLSESMASRRLIQILLLMIFSAQLGNAIGELILKIGEYQREQDPTRREAKRAEVVAAIRGVGQALIGLIQHICAMSHQTPQGQTHDRIVQESQVRPDGSRTVPPPPTDAQLPVAPVVEPTPGGGQLPRTVEPPTAPRPSPLVVPEGQAGGPQATPLATPGAPQTGGPQPTTLGRGEPTPPGTRQTVPDIPPTPGSPRGPNDTIPDMPAVRPEGDPHSRDTIPEMPAVRPDATQPDAPAVRPRGEPEARPENVRPEDQPGKRDFDLDPTDPVTRAARAGETEGLPRAEDGTVIMPRLANTFERFANPLEANQSYHELIDRTPNREAGIWFDAVTGEYVVVQGVEASVSPRFQGERRMSPDQLRPPSQGEWRLLEHFHPGSDTLARVPSDADFNHIMFEQRRTGRTEEVSSVVRYRNAAGREMTTRFGFEPGESHPYYFEYVANDGTVNRIRFSEDPWTTTAYDEFVQNFNGDPVPGGVLREGAPRRTPTPPSSERTQPDGRPVSDQETTQVRPRPGSDEETTQVFTRPGFEDEPTQIRPRPGSDEETTQVFTRPGFEDEPTLIMPRPDIHDETTQIHTRPGFEDEPTLIMPRPSIHDEPTLITDRPRGETVLLPPDPTAPRPQAKPDQPGQVVTDRSDPDRFLVREMMDPPPPPGADDNREAKYFMDAQRDPSTGDLSIDVRTASDDGSVRSSQLRGRDLYDQALEHFENQGTRITSVRSELANTNLNEFNAQMQASGHQMTFEQALLLTPSGKVLSSHGFVPSDVSVTPNPPGPYTSVRVHWTRP